MNEGSLRHALPCIVKLSRSSGIPLSFRVPCFRRRRYYLARGIYAVSRRHDVPWNFPGIFVSCLWGARFTASKCRLPVPSSALRQAWPAFAVNLLAREAGPHRGVPNCCAPPPCLRPLSVSVGIYRCVLVFACLDSSAVCRGCFHFLPALICVFVWVVRLRAALGCTDPDWSFHCFLQHYVLVFSSLFCTFSR